MTTAAPRKPRDLGPVHLYPERPKALKKGDNVALAANPDDWGRVQEVLPHKVTEPPRYAVVFVSGVRIVQRAELIARFTTETPRKKGRK
ncbi:hypothetical protein SEA_GARDENSTATE_39 [Microbacterium phage GardenState]|uniref:Uncharacterized protein n=2 Tax=Gardenstatevirus TaxID=3425012 RepID=A0A4Y6E723_9CAUD|nr:hypothetical protein SEA_IAMGROOT_39 [Microbacterium phage IAmGroot]QOI66951.1 hypothetical protein SEA_GARDENSTATE_39 [Microbacterium phage GardenState]